MLVSESKEPQKNSQGPNKRLAQWGAMTVSGACLLAGATFVYRGLSSTPPAYSKSADELFGSKEQPRFVATPPADSQLAGTLGSEHEEPSLEKFSQQIDQLIIETNERMDQLESSFAEGQNLNRELETGHTELEHLSAELREHLNQVQGTLFRLELLETDQSIVRADQLAGADKNGQFPHGNLGIAIEGEQMSSPAIDDMIDTHIAQAFEGLMQQELPQDVRNLLRRVDEPVPFLPPFTDLEQPSTNFSDYPLPQQAFVYCEYLHRLGHLISLHDQSMDGVAWPEAPLERAPDPRRSPELLVLEEATSIVFVQAMIEATQEQALRELALSYWSLNKEELLSDQWDSPGHDIDLGHIFQHWAQNNEQENETIQRTTSIEDPRISVLQLGTLLSEILLEQEKSSAEAFNRAFALDTIDGELFDALDESVGERFQMISESEGSTRNAMRQEIQRMALHGLKAKIIRLQGYLGRLSSPPPTGEIQQNPGAMTPEGSP